MASANQQLLDSAIAGSLDAVKNALAKGADIEAVNYFMQTALIIAALHGRKHVVQYIISQGGNIEAQDEAGWTALMWAARNDGDQTVNALLSNGANMNTQDKRGQTALMTAAEYGNKGAVKVLITHGADVSITNNDGQTALDLANKQSYLCHRRGYTAVIELLSNPPSATPTLTTEVESPTPEIVLKEDQYLDCTVDEDNYYPPQKKCKIWIRHSHCVQSSANTSSLSISVISVLQNDFKIADEQIDRPIKERDLFYLGGLFGAWTSYVGVLGLGLSDEEQHTIHADRDLIDQQKMSAALKVWQHRDQQTATFRNLLSIVLELNDLRVAKIICQYISKPPSVC